MHSIFTLQEKGDWKNIMAHRDKNPPFWVGSKTPTNHKLISNSFFLNLLKTSPTTSKYIQLCMLTYPDTRCKTGIRFNAYRDHLKECINYYMCVYLTLRYYLISDLSQNIIKFILPDEK